MNRRNITYSSKPNRAAKIAHREAKRKYPTYDTSLICPKKNKKPLILAIVIGILALIIIVGIIIFSCASYSKTLENGKQVEITINDGSSVWDIANILSENGVVENPSAFYISVTEKGVASQLKSGTYILDGGKTVDEYVDCLCEGAEKYSPKVVVSEGSRLTKIAENVNSATKNKISSDEFIKAASNASTYANEFSFLKDAGTNSLEGYLFPKTYTITSKDTAQDIIKKMLTTFKEETASLNIAETASKLKLNSYDIVKLASIVEKEAPLSCKPQVASVFINRLNKKMYLNSDATTAYEVQHNPSSEEIHAKSPYSTYTNYGLPPTPICSPSIESLKAVCNPADTKYLYFYFDDTGNESIEYSFSETFEDHQQKIMDYM